APANGAGATGAPAAATNGVTDESAGPPGAPGAPCSAPPAMGAAADERAPRGSSQGAGRPVRSLAACPGRYPGPDRALGAPAGPPREARGRVSAPSPETRRWMSRFETIGAVWLRRRRAEAPGPVSRPARVPRRADADRSPRDGAGRLWGPNRRCVRMMWSRVA